MSDATVTIIVALLGSSGLIGGVFSVINTILSRKAARSDKQKEIEKKLSDLEKATKENKLDSVRLQMLVMISDYPNDTSEIMRIAEHYFSELKGNWYMTSIFNTWLESNNIAKPEWFKND